MFIQLDSSYTLSTHTVIFEFGEDCYSNIDESILSHLSFSSKEILPEACEFVTFADGYHEVLINIIIQ
jgi:hypothetical protein